MKIFNITLAVLFVALSVCKADESASQTLLLRQPAISQDHLAFVYAGDIWIANTDGTHPRRLTSHPATEGDPVFSPDGKWIAFSANYENNRDVYIIPVEGGQPSRLTWHPLADVPHYWSEDGKFVYFTSSRETDHGRSRQLYKVSIGGGAPIKEMDARIVQGSVNASGELAYIIYHPAYNGLYGGSSGWKGYRGGTAPEIQIMSGDRSSVRTLPGQGSVSFNPFWLDGHVYFISDREDNVFNIFKFDPKKDKLSKITHSKTWDVRSASGYGNTLVYEAGGHIYSYDLKKEKNSEITVSISPDLPQLRQSWKDASANITHFDLSKTGKRALITARGEVFTVPTKDGSTRNLSQSGGKHEYSALWSPDGMQIAWITETDDQKGQVAVISDQFGETEPKVIALGTYFYELKSWVGGKTQKLIYSDNHLGLFVLDIISGQSTVIDHNVRRSGFAVSVSPDGNWIAYTKEQSNFNSDLMLYNIETADHFRVSDGMADTGSPAFSPDGKYLYFIASTNTGPVQVGLNMTSQEKPVRSGIYGVVLAADGKSPLLPKAGDETEKEKAGDKTEAKDSDQTAGTKSTADAKPEDKVECKDESPKTVVDITGIQDRIICLPVAERQLDNLRVDKDGNLYYVEYVQAGVAKTVPGQSLAADNRLMRFCFEDQSESELLKGVSQFTFSADQNHLLINKWDGTLITSEAGKSLDVKPLSLGDCRINVSPREEWVQIFNEVWRMEKDYFYAPNLHGLDWDAVYNRYRPLVEHVGRREDLNELMVEMIAEFCAGHNRVLGGDTYSDSEVPVGMLGCNYTIVDGRYRVSEVYTGAPWTPFLNGPLSVPGNEVKAGDYLIAINHRNLSSSDNIFEALQDTVGKQITLTVSTSPEGSDSRDVVVMPITHQTESSLRLWQWVEKNRAWVSDKTDGQVGYIYLPNTADDGYLYFNRMFFAQVDKKALIIDERSNGGGQAADYIIETLARRHLSGWADRDGLIYNTPSGAQHGPKLMMIDQDAGSGGDYLPFMFRYAGIGKLLGTRTWGGLIGIYANPPLIDGGIVCVPFFRFFDANNNWSVENEGVAPDIEVKLDPIATNKGIDNQLNAAIDEILSELKTFQSTIATEAPVLPTKLGE